MAMIAYLNITTWSGLLMAASHYYAELKWNYDNSHTLTTRLTQRQAIGINRSRWENEFSSFKVKAGDISDAFFSLETAYQAAKDVWREICPECNILVVGHPADLGPLRILAVNPPNQDIIDLADQLHQRCEDFGWGNNLDKYDKAIDEWEKLIKSFEKSKIKLEK